MLKPSNYSLWAIRMQIILEANGLWEMIEPLETTQSDNKKDKTAIAFLYQALPEEQLLQITKHKTAKAIWDALKTRHIGEERVQQARLQTLKSDFEMLHMKEDETIDTFTGKLTTLVNKAASLGHTIEDSVVVRKLLNAVPDKFLQIVASIEQYSDLDEMSVDEAIGRLKTFEERLKSQGKPFRERGRFNQSRGREQDKNNYQSKREERASFKEDTRDKSQVTCYRYHKLGHYAYECPNKRKNQVREQSNLIEEDIEPTLLMTTITEKKMIQPEIAESVEIAESAEDSRECRKFQIRSILQFRMRKPIWFYVMNRFFSGVYINDTLKGHGIEATLTLSPDEMAMVECDPELLSYASVNPSPI
ncbi:zinc finger, CCHC-type containing protein [Tanacetum coccineum]|uniref:Zinc finger, CCHC-type containing protein n=1 Tax=Tanacetum coccineum TaxID=301880 RepID=A0ABQ5GD88_9ASTR